MVSQKEPMISVKTLSKHYDLSSGGAKDVLKSISFDVQREEILGIIGKSGAGKTTLLRILRAVEPFDEGEITIDGVMITPESTAREVHAVKEKTAIHLQRSFAFWSESTLMNMVKRVQALRRGDEVMALPEEYTTEYDDLESESMRLLEIVGLSHKAKQAAHTLSGGEKQRLQLARQLAIQPSVLLLDEPLTMASPDNKRDAIDAVRRIHNEMGMTTIVVSHMPQIHHELSDRLIWMEGGVIKDIGSVDDVVKKFMAQVEPSTELHEIEEKKPIFKLDHVSKVYYHYDLSKLFEIYDIDLEVNEGEILGIIGPSGVGKTVLMRILAGLELPTGGKVLMYNKKGDAIDLSKMGMLSAIMRQDIGILHQEFALTHHALVKDQIASRRRFKSLTEDEFINISKKLRLRESLLDFALRLSDMPGGTRKNILEELDITEDDLAEIYSSLPVVGIDEDRAKSILDFLDMSPEILDRRSYELSGGELIRVALAIEIATQPRMLILDEPFGDLDPITTRKVSNMVKDVSREYETSFIIVTHDRELLADTAHKIIMVDEGEIREKVSKDELRNII